MATARSRAAGDTDPGLQREQNEDRFFFDEAKGVYCVIDGVGGHNAGERAAAIAADVLRASMDRTSEADLRFMALLARLLGPPRVRRPLARRTPRSRTPARTR